MNELILWLPTELASLPRYVVALAIGLLMGLERERNPTAKAGLRTFALTALLGAVCLALSATVAGQPTSVFTFNVLIAQFVVGWSLAAVALAAGASSSQGFGRTAASLTLGLLIFQALTFAYYVSLDLRLPVQRTDLFGMVAARPG